MLGVKTNRTFQEGDRVFIKVYDANENLIEIEGVVTRVSVDLNYQGGFIEIQDKDGGIVSGSAATVSPSHQRQWKNRKTTECKHLGCAVMTRSETGYCRSHRPSVKYR